MATYNPWTPDEYAVGAPGTSLSFQRWFENWEAGFEGALGAPRLALKARKGLPLVTSNTTTPAAIIGLGDLAFATFLIQFQGATSLAGEGQISFTNDGTSWAGWLAFVNSNPSGGMFSCVMHYDRPSGLLLMGGLQLPGGAVLVASNLTPGASFQGLRIRCGSGVAGWVNRVTLLNGGVA